MLFGLGTLVYDWYDPFGTFFLETLGQGRRIRGQPHHLRTRERMAKVRVKGRLEEPTQSYSRSTKTIYRRYHDLDDDARLADRAEEYSTAGPRV
ncbi:hypothetical protein [Nocardia sp. NBC_00511]|uniref:hypothetical protein n=1 Tax=Nocardia sp. NBC_00511 TaxID=2903591 RepID=UPI0030E380D2